MRGLPVHAVRISAAFCAIAGSKSLQIAFEVTRLRRVAVRLQAIEDRHARIARGVLVLFRDAAERGQAAACVAFGAFVLSSSARAAVMIS